MAEFKVRKTYQEINDKIKKGKVVVVNAEEMIDIVAEKGEVAAAREVDVVTTGTFGAMCSSGAILNVGHTTPKMKISRAKLNGVPAFCGLAAVDLYVGASELPDEDPRNTVFPGEFRYGGAHVIQDLLKGNPVIMEARAYGTDCYPRRYIKKELYLRDLKNAILFNPRNAYQNYNCAVNSTEKTIYTYMGVLKPGFGNATYSTAGQISPLLNDPLFKTIGIGTRIFLGGTQGFVAYHGTQHTLDVDRMPNGTPVEGAGTLCVIGNLKEMNPQWIVAASLQGYGVSLYVGIGVPIPVLNEEMARYTAVKDEDIVTQIIDYGADYPQGISRSLGTVNYKMLREGTITLEGEPVPATPMASYPKALEISNILKEEIQKGHFFLGEAQPNLARL